MPPCYSRCEWRGGAVGGNKLLPRLKGSEGFKLRVEVTEEARMEEVSRRRGR